MCHVTLTGQNRRPTHHHFHLSIGDDAAGFAFARLHDRLLNPGEALIMSRRLNLKYPMLLATLGLASPCPAAQAEPWTFGVMADTQWTTNDAANNPGTVALGIMNQILPEFVNKRSSSSFNSATLPTMAATPASTSGRPPRASSTTPVSASTRCAATMSRPQPQPLASRALPADSGSRQQCRRRHWSPQPDHPGRPDGSDLCLRVQQRHLRRYRPVQSHHRQRLDQQCRARPGGLAEVHAGNQAGRQPTLSSLPTSR